MRREGDGRGALAPGAMSRIPGGATSQHSRSGCRHVLPQPRESSRHGNFPVCCRDARVPARSRPCERRRLVPHCSSAQGSSTQLRRNTEELLSLSLAWLALTDIMELLVPDIPRCIQDVHPHLSSEMCTHHLCSKCCGHTGTETPPHLLPGNAHLALMSQNPSIRPGQL